jgi:hypothetical protein
MNAYPRLPRIARHVKITTGKIKVAVSVELLWPARPDRSSVGQTIGMSVESLWPARLDRSSV